MTFALIRSEGGFILTLNDYAIVPCSKTDSDSKTIFKIASCAHGNVRIERSI